MSNLTFAFAIGIGFVAGLRTMLAPAAVVWAVHLGWLHLEGTRLGFVGSKVALILISLFALAELVGDKLPRMPKRTAAAPLIARLLSGGFCGACLSVSAGQSSVLGAALGAVGALAGAFVGYEARKRIVEQLGLPDFVIALVEDAVAFGLALFFVSR